MAEGGLQDSQLAVEERKLTHYLLDLGHRDGHGKARFFRSFGFVPEQWEVLAAALKAHASSNPVKAHYSTRHGERFEVEGLLECPDGRTCNVRTAWHRSPGQRKARLITAHPLKRLKPRTGESQ